MLEFADRPAPRWLIPDLIPDCGLGFLIGQPGAGKSFFLQELAQSVGRNLPLLNDPELRPVRAGWVLCFLPEASLSWSVRTRTYCSYHNLGYSDQVQYCTHALDLGDSTSWIQLLAAVKDEAAKRGGPPALIILDTLSAAIPGRDENSQSDMTPVMSHLQELAGMGSAVIVAHHPAKYSSTYRGSSVLRGSCDWMISVLELPGGIREFRADKLRDVEKITKKSFLIQKHAESAVCASSDVQGPWGLLEAVAEQHPGLKEALLIHGLEVPGEIRRKASGGDITAEGISLKRINETWRNVDPLRPAHSEDPKGYKATTRQRTTALINVISSMIRTGVLKLVSGDVSKSDRKLDGMVRQVMADADA
jgi:hypothetical protein